MIQLNVWIEQIIDTIEIHTETKPSDDAKNAVIKAYKSLYILKDYFEKNQEIENNLKNIGE